VRFWLTAGIATLVLAAVLAVIVAACLWVQSHPGKRGR
jgi:hypothetical protein